MKTTEISTRSNQRGFSLLEILIVLAIIAVLSSLTGYFLTAYTRLHRVEDQALKIADILQEAKQQALNQRQIMRVEINTVQNAVVIIDENAPNTAGDDRELKRLMLASPAEVRVGLPPENITVEPGEPTPVPKPVFAPSSHPLSIAQPVAVLRFTSSGMVLDAGNNSIGAGAAMTGMTVYVWKGVEDAQRNLSSTTADMTRGITVLGSSGTVRVWNYGHTAENPGWSRR